MYSISESTVCFKWAGVFQFCFCIKAGVRQGGILSLVLFAVFTDTLIERLRQVGLGCRILDQFYGCLLYADDILLLSHSVNAMRRMLLLSDQFAADFDMKFNSGKSVVLRIGNRHYKYVPFTLNGEVLKFVCDLKYLSLVYI